MSNSGADRGSLPRRVAREVKVHSQAYAALRGARRAARSPTLIVGPWTSEVGFELLYWIPFVRRRLREPQRPPEQVVVVSRGGVEPWYGGIATRYVEILDLIPAERLLDEWERRRRTRTGEKQMAVTALDREIVAAVRESIGDPGAELLHPSAMYRRYRAVWMRRRPPAVVEREVDFAAITVPSAPPSGLRDGEYIAVKPYFSSSFPAKETNRAALYHLLKNVCQHAPVVLLEDGGALGGHEHPELSDLDLIVPPQASSRSNLGRQTEIVQGAKMLVATYGGFSYLGPLLGVPTCAFYSEAVWNTVHLELLRSATRRIEAAGDTPRAGYQLLDVAHTSLIERLAPRALEERAGRAESLRAG